MIRIRCERSRVGPASQSGTPDSRGKDAAYPGAYHHGVMADLLSDAQVDEALGQLPQWRREGDALERTVELSDFPHAIQVVNRVAEMAESVNHHPDIDIRWRTLTFRLSTHSAGGLTEKDTSMAAQIDGVIDIV
jgi:4a-hydroxytetrahydrobiopterin dehydratase